MTLLSCLECKGMTLCCKNKQFYVVLIVKNAHN